MTVLTPVASLQDRPATTPAPLDRHAIASMIVDRLQAATPASRAQFDASRFAIGHFVVDDLLPSDVARRLYASFPATGALRLRRTIRESKFVGAQMDAFDPILEEALFAFQDPRVVALVGACSGLRDLEPDASLYAGGISMMGDGAFLNPHLDNSHDQAMDRWRTLNLLYYVTPAWPVDRGGDLELWPHGVDAEPIRIHSRFNRLVVMSTHDTSWHSVHPVRVDEGAMRCCISNYYFSKQPPKDDARFHVTSFRGRPEQRVLDWVLRVDSGVRMMVRKVFRRGIVQTAHVYRRPDADAERTD